jgi:hypothetical protein
MVYSKITPDEFKVLMRRVWEQKAAKAKLDEQGVADLKRRIEAVLLPLPIFVQTLNDGTKRVFLFSDKLGVNQFYDL